MSILLRPEEPLRNDFFWRRHPGRDYLALLPFFLNHRRFVRSEQAERVDLLPARSASERLSLAGAAGW